MSGLSDEIGDIFSGVTGLLVGLFLKPIDILGFQITEGDSIMSIMLLLCTIAIVIRKYYHAEFSEHWDYLYLITMPLGMCLGRVILIMGLI
ncbi:MAG: hypothetical protein M0R17_07100 [Candidatus Omnitrophica bacterium]|jgi:hypothetical protein|nr:hypothetical protein [Candidatus Omnitrophota bacterium]